MLDLILTALRTRRGKKEFRLFHDRAVHIMIAHQLRTMRETRSLTQQQVATALKIKQS